MILILTRLLTKIRQLSSKHKDTKLRDPESITTEDMTNHLKSHVEMVNHDNSQLQAKLLQYQTIYDNDIKRKSLYTHIPPRVESACFVNKGLSRTYGADKSPIKKRMAKENETIHELYIEVLIRQALCKSYQQKLGEQEEKLKSFENKQKSIADIKLEY